MTKAVGTRVGAILSADEHQVNFLGYGVYQGELIPEDENVLIMGFSAKERGIKNPCILLDNGDKVYGCECWWGPEEEIISILTDGRVVVDVRIGDYRRKEVNLEEVLVENGHESTAGRATSSNPPTTAQNDFFPNAETPAQTDANNPPRDEQPATLPDTQPADETSANETPTAQGHFANDDNAFGGGGAGADWQDVQVETTEVYVSVASDEPSAASSDE